MISKKFHEVQTRHYRELNEERCAEELEPLPRKFNGDTWAKEFIKQIVYYALTQWQIRNDNVHEGKEQDEKKRRRREVDEEIMKWYERKDEVDTRMKILFKLPLMFRYMKSMRSKEAWLRTITLESEITSEDHIRLG